MFLEQWTWPIITFDSYPLQLSGLRAQSFSLEGGRSAIDYYEDDDDDDEDDDYIPDPETGTQNEFHCHNISLVLLALKYVLWLINTTRGKDKDRNQDTNLINVSAQDRLIIAAWN